MIQQTLKEAFEQLVPTAAPSAADSGDDDTAKDSGPRPDGVIETDYARCGFHLDLQLRPEQLRDAVALVNTHKFFIESITGVDWIDDGEIEVIYDFSRFDFDLCRVVIRTRTDRDNATIPSISSIYSGARWHERETAEFFGVNFAGHPNLINLLLPEDADYHPLRKDFKP